MWHLYPQEPAGEGAVGGQDGNNLRQGVGALMDAMRDLLNNIRPMDPPVENQNGEEEEEEDPEEWDWSQEGLILGCGRNCY